MHTERGSAGFRENPALADFTHCGIAIVQSRSLTYAQQTLSFVRMRLLENSFSRFHIFSLHIFFSLLYLGE